MLPLIIPSEELWDERATEFVSFPETHLSLEHSLISLSKWEQHYKVPFLNRELSNREFVYYIECMSMTKGVPETEYARILMHPELIQKIKDYMSDPMTATTFNHDNIRKMNNNNNNVNGEVTTAETVYCWMAALSIPFTCEKWHFNRLMALIELCNLKQTPGKEMSQKEILQQQAARNKARRPKKPNVKQPRLKGGSK